ncbi:hypothetical protein [Lentzea sp. NPDC003310]|uniref:hypothetical protein n=1 Tax=Lentzea sp. NPDC003310 TaxID=3154447 RepID=UPI0033AFCEBC
MGEWKRVVPSGELSGHVFMAAASGGFLVLVVAAVVLAPGPVESWSGVLSAMAFCGGLSALMWRAARAGVHFGPRGVLIYHATRRAELVPWDDVVRFEPREVRLAQVPVKGAVVYLVQPMGDLLETPLTRSVGAGWDRAAYSWKLEVVLTEAEFAAAVDQLNAALWHYTGRT